MFLNNKTKTLSQIEVC